MTVQLKDALAKVAEAVKTAEVKLGAAPAYADSAYFQRRKAVFAECEAHLALTTGGRINDRWNGCSVRIAGVSSTCTAGLPGALQNWSCASSRQKPDGSARTHDRRQDRLPALRLAPAQP